MRCELLPGDSEGARHALLMIRPVGLYESRANTRCRFANDAMGLPERGPEHRVRDTRAYDLVCRETVLDSFPARLGHFLYKNLT